MPQVVTHGRPGGARRRSRWATRSSPCSACRPRSRSRSSASATDHRKDAGAARSRRSFAAMAPAPPLDYDSPECRPVIPGRSCGAVRCSSAALPQAWRRRPTSSHAQGTDWPKGPIKFVVPFPPGGSTDPVARLIQARLAETVGWNIIVDNKPGARRRDRRGDRGQVAARRPDLDDHVRQPHPEPGLHAQPALQGFRPAERHAGRPRAARHRLPSRPALQEFRRRDRRREAAAGQAQRRRALGQPGAAADHATCRKRTASTST